MSAILRHTLERSSESHGGICCVFVPHPRLNTGLKIYKDRETAEQARHNQEVAHTNGVGPKVGRKVFSVSRAIVGGKAADDWRHRGFDNTAFAFWTEKVRCNTNYYDNNGDWRRTYIFKRKDGEPSKTYTKAKLRLSNKIQSIGFGVDDLHDYNIGRNSNGKLVCIDFDPIRTNGHGWRTQAKKRVISK